MLHICDLNEYFKFMSQSNVYWLAYYINLKYTELDWGKVWKW